MVELRRAMFDRLLDAQPALFTQPPASSLTNTADLRVQTGASLLMHSLLSTLRDSLTLVALLTYLLWLNWKLTLFVAVLFPPVAWLMRKLSRRLHRLTVEARTPPTTLAYVIVGRTCWPGASCACIRRRPAGARFAHAQPRCAGLAIKPRSRPRP